MRIPSFSPMLLAAGLLTLAPGFSAFGENTPAGVRDALKEMPRPWRKAADRRPPETEDYASWRDIQHQRALKENEFEPLMKYYAAKSKHFSYRELTKNALGQPLFLVEITDRNAPAEEQAVVLVTTFDGGTEKTGPTSAFRLIEYLIGDEPEAAETRRKQRIMIVPITNPAGFFQNKPHPANVNLYTGNRGSLWQLPEMKLKEPDRVPELVAFARLIDEHRPEVHVDLHGTDPAYRGRIMVESTGCAGSNSTFLAWDARLIDAMNEAGERAGYSYFRPDREMQRLIGGSPDFSSLRTRMAAAVPLVYSGLYGYLRCHTLPLVMEIAWEESALARLRGLFAIGNGKHPEFPDGYPVDKLKVSDSGVALMSGGRTVAERRASRAELWHKQEQLVIGMAYPLFEGRELFYCAVGEDGLKALFGDQTPGLLVRKERIIASMLQAPGVNAPALEQFLKLGPENMFWTYLPDRAEPVEAIRHGLRLRCLLQYADAAILDVRMNGNRLKEDPNHGYTVTRHRGRTLLTVHLPSEVCRNLPLMIVSCAYNGKQPRSNWTPPADLPRQ